MRSSAFILIIIIVALVGGIAGYTIGTHKYPTLGSTPIGTISPTQMPPPTHEPSPTSVLSPTMTPLPSNAIIVTPTKSPNPTM